MFKIMLDLFGRKRSEEEKKDRSPLENIAVAVPGADLYLTRPFQDRKDSSSKSSIFIASSFGFGDDD